MIISNLIFTGAGGALGAVIRGYFGKLISSKFPWATIIVNVVGSFFAGMLISIFATNSFEFSHKLELISLGFCGGFTTFSSFSFQTLQLLREGKRKSAILNIFISLFFSLIAAWLGIIIFTGL